MDELIPMKPKASRRFYEPIVLYSALSDIRSENGPARQSQPRKIPRTEEERFHAFVCKLANVCDNVKGGPTVTSFAVLQRQQTVLYVFGSNQREAEDLAETEEFVRELLESCADEEQPASDVKPRSVKAAMLKHILAFNRPRVEIYVRHLKEQLLTCLEVCEGQDTEAEQSIKKSLQGLSDALAEVEVEDVDESEYLGSCMLCYRELLKFFKLNKGVNNIINHRAREGRLRDGKSTECWSELRHYISRLFAYEEAVVAFLEAKQEWPDLFEDFEVRSLPSSHPEPNPLKKKSEVAGNVIGRMTSDEQVIARYRGFAESLQVFDLDERMRTQCAKQGFRPIVHCEVLVLDWVCANLRALGLEFYRDMRYIGSSKPACKLCDYYFRGHQSRIETRPTHGNLYTNWRFPDVSKKDGTKAVQRRQAMMNYMMERIRGDAFEILEKKLPMGKRHDSNTYSVASTTYSMSKFSAEVHVRKENVATVNGLGALFDEKLSFGSF